MRRLFLPHSARIHRWAWRELEIRVRELTPVVWGQLSHPTTRLGTPWRFCCSDCNESPTGPTASWFAPAGANWFNACVCVCTDTDSSFKNVDRESWSLFTADAIDNIVIRRQRKRDSEICRRLGLTSTKFGRDSELTDDRDRQNSPSVGARV